MSLRHRQDTTKKLPTPCNGGLFAERVLFSLDQWCFRVTVYGSKRFKTLVMIHLLLGRRPVCLLTVRFSRLSSVQIQLAVHAKFAHLPGRGWPSLVQIPHIHWHVLLCWRLHFYRRSLRIACLHALLQKFQNFGSMPPCIHTSFINIRLSRYDHIYTLCADRCWHANGLTWLPAFSVNVMSLYVSIVIRNLRHVCIRRETVQEMFLPKPTIPRIPQVNGGSTPMNISWEDSGLQSHTLLPDTTQS